jgi:hypothetical protein
MNCEEEMRVKNEMGEVRGMYVSGGGEVKRKGGGTWVVGKKKERKKKKEMRRCGTWVVGKKERKKKWEMGGVYGGKKGEGKRKKRKN